MIRCYTEFPLEALNVHASWEYNNGVWGCTFKRDGDVWYKYDPSDDHWSRIGTDPRRHVPNNPTIYLVSE